MRTAPNCFSSISASEAGRVSSASLFNASSRPTRTEGTCAEMLQESSRSGKRAVDQRDGRKRIDGDVVGGGEGGGAWLALGEGMAGAGEGGELVVEQLERADVRRLYRTALDVDDEMTAGVAERVGVIVAVRRHPSEPHIGRNGLQALAERLHQNKLSRLARGDREIAYRKRRIERLVGPEQALHAGKDHMHGGRKLERLGGRNELLAGAHEQLVVEDFPKFCKSMADR